LELAIAIRTDSPAGAVTVTFAKPDPLNIPLVAIESTAYVPGAVPLGAVLVIATEPVCPGLRTKAVDENDVSQFEGWLELRLNVPEEHPAESLLITETV
jgi:hypothetical protein